MLRCHLLRAWWGRQARAELALWPILLTALGLCGPRTVALPRVP